MRNSIFTAMIGAAAISLGLSGCAKSADKGADADSIKQTIKADEAKWNKDFKAKDIEALAGHYSDDAFVVVPGQTANGSTAIRQIFATASTDPAFAVEFASDKVDVASAGDVAYARGKFTEKYTDKKSGKVMSGNGSYLAIYKKQDDGGWKVIDDVVAVDPTTVKEVAPEKPATRAKMVSF